VTGYKLYSDYGKPGNQDLIYDGTGEVEILAFTHRGLQTGVQYYYWLQVLNFNGGSQLSDAVERPACEIPQEFQSLSVKSTSVSVTKLAWRQPVDIGGCTIESYRVLVDDGSLGDFVDYGNLLSASIFELDLTGLTYTLSYRFKIIAKNHIGSTESNVVSALIADVPAQPASAPGFVADETTSDSIRVTLQEVTTTGGSDIISYQLQRTETGGSTFFDVVGSVQNQTIYTQHQVEGLEKGAAYRFRYRALNRIGAGAWSAESYLTPAVKATAPPKPVFLSADA
jgi:predicted phage tail protein